MQKENSVRFSRKAGRIIAYVATKAATIEANTTCPFYHYQPQEPKKVKQLRKF